MKPHHANRKVELHHATSRALPQSARGGAGQGGEAVLLLLMLSGVHVLPFPLAVT